LCPPGTSEGILLHLLRPLFPHWWSCPPRAWLQFLLGSSLPPWRPEWLRALL
jgi:hypothetical protein